MKLLSGLARTAILLMATGSSYGAIVSLITGNAYGGSGQRANFLTLMPFPLLTYDNVDLATECTSPCAYSFNRNSATTTNVSGQTISGVTFIGANTGAAGNNLQVRPLNETNRNQTSGPNYNQLNSAAANYQAVLWPQWTIGFATAPNVTGAPSMNITTMPTGTRSVAFDYGSINAPVGTYSIQVRTASGFQPETQVNNYLVGSSYNTSGPGFYGVTSTEDILTISIIANASSSQWILNLANFRVGVQINAPVPEPATHLTFAAALIALSLLIRRRHRNTPGGTA